MQAHMQTGAHFNTEIYTLAHINGVTNTDTKRWRHMDIHVNRWAMCRMRLGLYPEMSI
jgi:hypothetical protein